jgi:hypothetical protein
MAASRRSLTRVPPKGSTSLQDVVDRLDTFEHHCDQNVNPFEGSSPAATSPTSSPTTNRGYGSPPDHDRTCGETTPDGPKLLR